LGPSTPEDINTFFNTYSVRPLYEKSEPIIGFVLPQNNLMKEL